MGSLKRRPCDLPIYDDDDENRKPVEPIYNDQPPYLRAPPEFAQKPLDTLYDLNEKWSNSLDSWLVAPSRKVGSSFKKTISYFGPEGETATSGKPLVIGGVGLVSLFLARRRGMFGKLFYLTSGVLGSAAVCYPECARKQITSTIKFSKDTYDKYYGPKAIYSSATKIDFSASPQKTGSPSIPSTEMVDKIDNKQLVGKTSDDKISN